MAMGIKIVSSFFVMVAVFSSIVSPNSAILGRATYYTNYVPSKCFGGKDQGTMVVAVHPQIFRNGALCGQATRVLCAKGAAQPDPCKGTNSVNVKIVDVCGSDKCPNYNDIVLSKEAFSLLADPNIGSIPIDFD